MWSPLVVHSVPTARPSAVDNQRLAWAGGGGWDTHPIHLMMQQLRKRVIAWLDGYDAAEWLI